MQLEIIQNKIYEIRDQRIMLDFDLAEMYEIETRVLKQSVKRNLKRFPKDFMFQISKKEAESLVSQNVIPKIQVLGGSMPFAFTEHGVTMLASILRSDKAIKVNIAIVRAFVMLRKFVLTNKELAAKLAKLERRYNKQFKDVYEALDYLMNEKKKLIDFEKRERIGFKK